MDSLEGWHRRQADLRSDFVCADENILNEFQRTENIELDFKLTEFKHYDPIHNAKHLHSPLVLIHKRSVVPLPPFQLKSAISDSTLHRNEPRFLTYLFLLHFSPALSVALDEAIIVPHIKPYCIPLVLREKLAFDKLKMSRLNLEQVNFDLIPDSPCPELERPIVESISLIVVPCPERVFLSCNYILSSNLPICYTEKDPMDIPGYLIEQYDISKASLNSFSSNSLPGTIIVTGPVFSKYPCLIQELMRRNHEIVDRQSYDGLAWIYTRTQRFILLEKLGDYLVDNGPNNLHLIQLHLSKGDHLFRGEVERLLMLNITLHHAETVQDVINIIESFGMEFVHIENETAWERFSAIHNKATFNPLVGI